MEKGLGDFSVSDERRHSEVNGRGPLPMKAMCRGGVGSTVWRAASSRRVRSM